jgi:hypothetical protein
VPPRSAPVARLAELPVAVLRHPLGAREMALECPPGAMGITVRVMVQHHACDFAPVRTFRVGIEQTEIRDEVLEVVGRQFGA